MDKMVKQIADIKKYELVRPNNDYHSVQIEHWSPFWAGVPPHFSGGLVLLNSSTK